MDSQSEMERGEPEPKQKLLISGNVSPEEAIKGFEGLTLEDVEIVNDPEAVKGALRDWLFDTTGKVQPPLAVITPTPTAEGQSSPTAPSVPPAPNTK